MKGPFPLHPGPHKAKRTLWQHLSGRYRAGRVLGHRNVYYCNRCAVWHSKQWGPHVEWCPKCRGYHRPTDKHIGLRSTSPFPP